MKLTNQQVRVLAEEILGELKVEASKYKESPEYVNFEDTLKGDSKYKGLVKLTTTIQSAIKDGIIEEDYNSRSLTSRVEDYVDKLRKRAFPSITLPSQQSVENKIILNTIGIDNLDDLIAKVKESLKK